MDVTHLYAFLLRCGMWGFSHCFFLQLGMVTALPCPPVSDGPGMSLSSWDTQSTIWGGGTWWEVMHRSRCAQGEPPPVRCPRVPCLVHLHNVLGGRLTHHTVGIHSDQDPTRAHLRRAHHPPQKTDRHEQPVQRRRRSRWSGWTDGRSERRSRIGREIFGGIYLLLGG